MKLKWLLFLPILTVILLISIEVFAGGKKMKEPVSSPFELVLKLEPKRQGKLAEMYDDTVERIDVSIVNHSKQSQILRILDYHVTGFLANSNRKVIDAKDNRAIIDMAFPKVTRKDFTILNAGESAHVIDAAIRKAKDDELYKINLGSFQSFENLKPGFYYLKIKITGLVGEESVNRLLAKELKTPLTWSRDVESKEFEFNLK